MSTCTAPEDFFTAEPRGTTASLFIRLGEDGRMTLVGHEPRGINVPQFHDRSDRHADSGRQSGAANVTNFLIDRTRELEPIGKHAGGCQSIIRRRRHVDLGNRIPGLFDCDGSGG